MALSQDTVKEIFVTTGLAAETTLKTFQADAADGEIGVFNSDGSDGDTEDDFLIALKIEGKTITSDLYRPEDLKRVKAIKGVEETFKEVTFTPETLTLGTEFIIELRFQEVGSLSPNNFYSKFGFHTVTAADVAGSTASLVVDALIASLNKNFSKEPDATASTNPYFTFTNNAGVLEILEKEQTFELGKDEGRRLIFDLIEKDGVGSVAQSVAPVYGVATGKQVSQMEYFYRGNRGDQFGKQHFPYNWSTKTKTTATDVLHSLIEGYVIREDKTSFNTTNSKKAFVVAVPVGEAASEYTAINAIIAKIELVTGKTIADLAV